MIKKLKVEIKHCLECPYSTISTTQLGHPYICTYKGNRTYILNSTSELTSAEEHLEFFKTKYENKDFPIFCPIPD